MSRELSQRSLQAFRLTMMTGSVTAAAVALNRTQPAISRLLKELEYSVGFDLFNRVKGRLIPTTKAWTFFKQVQHSYVALERLGTIAAEIREDRFGRFSIAAFPAVSLSIMPRVLSSMLKSNAEMQLIYDMLPTDAVIQKVLTRECDLGLVNAPFDLIGVIFERRYKVPFVCMLPEGHPLTGQDVVSVAELFEHPVITIGTTTSFGAQINHLWMQQQTSAPVRVETNSAFSAANLVRAGIGATIIDPLTAADHKRKGGIVRRLDVEIPCDIGLIRLPQHSLTKAQEIFIAVFERELRGMLSDVVDVPMTVEG